MATDFQTKVTEIESSLQGLLTLASRVNRELAEVGSVGILGNLAGDLAKIETAFNSFSLEGFANKLEKERSNLRRTTSQISKDIAGIRKLLSFDDLGDVRNFNINVSVNNLGEVQQLAGDLYETKRLINEINAMRLQVDVTQTLSDISELASRLQQLRRSAGQRARYDLTDRVQGSGSLASAPVPVVLERSSLSQIDRPLTVQIKQQQVKTPQLKVEPLEVKIRTDDIVSNAALYNKGEPLTKDQSTAIRAKARRVYDEAFPQMRGGEPVHHRIPLYYAHLFDKDPNRLSNLQVLPKKVHDAYDYEWSLQRRVYGRNRNPQDVLNFADELDDKARMGQLDVKASQDAVSASGSFTGFLKNVNKNAKEISRIYGRYQFGVSQIGGMFNGLIEVSKAIEGALTNKAGLTPAKIVDIGSGIIRFMHSLQSLNSFFNLGILPQVLEGVFQQRRSETVADLLEGTVMAWTGHRPKEGARSRLKPQDKVNEDDLSTGAHVRGDALAVGALRQDVQSSKSYIKEYTKASQRIERAFAVAFPGTAITNKNVRFALGNSGKSTADIMIDTGVFDSTFGGDTSVRNTFEHQKALGGHLETYGSSALGIVTDQIIARNANLLDVLSHEFTHAVTGRYSNLGMGKGDQELFVDSNGNFVKEKLFNLALEARSNARNGIAALPEETPFQTHLRKQMKDPLFREYYFNADEILANVGAAQIGGNKQQQDFIRNMYGEELYSATAKELQRKLPEVYKDLDKTREKLSIIAGMITEEEQRITGRTITDPVPVSTARVSQFQRVINTVFNLSEQIFRSLPESIQQLIDSIRPLLNNVASNFSTLFGGVGTSGNIASNASFANMPSSFTGVVQQTFGKDPKTLIQELVGGTGGGFSGAVKRAGIGFGYDLLSNKNFQQRSLDIITNTVPQQLPKIIPFIARQVKDAIAPGEVDAYRVFAAETYKRTGQAITGYEQQTFFDMDAGLQRVTGSMRLASGAVVQLNGVVDELGRVKIDKSKVGNAAKYFEQVVIGAFRQIGENIVFSGVDALQRIFTTIISTQDDLNELSLILGASTKEEINTVRSGFISQAVQGSAITGRTYDETLQTNLKNIKLFQFVSDTAQRQELANRMSTLQLGTQTVFNIPLETAMRDIPAIFAQFNDSLTEIEDPSTRASAAMDRVAFLFDKLTIAQRASAADGQNLVNIFSELTPSMTKFGMSVDDLMVLSAVSDVAIASTPEETSNILKMILERSTGSGKSQLEGLGISTAGGPMDTLRQIYQLSLDPSKRSDYQSALNAIGAQRQAAEAAKVVRAIGTNEERVRSAVEGAQGNEFDKILNTRVQNFVGQVNTLQSALARTGDLLLNNTGLLDLFTAAIRNIGGHLTSLGDFLEKYSDQIGNLITGDGILGINAVDLAKQQLAFSGISMGINPVTGISKLINETFTRLRGSVLKFADFGLKDIGTSISRKATDVAIKTIVPKVESFIRGPSAITASPLVTTSVDRLGAEAATASAALTRLTASASRASAVITRPTAPILPQALSSQQSVLGLGRYASYGQLTTVPVNLTAQATRRQMPRIFSRIAENLPSTVANTVTSLWSARPVAPGGSSFTQGERWQRFSDYGGAAGALALPAAMDLMFGGGGKDNLTNVGVGIVGGMVGAFAGPYGAVMGYTLAKSFSESLDLSGIVGTSEKEESGVVSFVQRQFSKTVEQRTKEEELRPEVENKVRKEVLEFFNANLLKQAYEDAGIYGDTNLLRTPVTSDDVLRVLNNRATGLSDDAGFDPLNRIASGQAARFADLLSRPEFANILQLVKETKLSNLYSDIPNTILAASRNESIVSTRLDEEVLAAFEESAASQISAAQAGADIFKNAQDNMSRISAELDALYGDRPYGGLMYGEGGSAVFELDRDYKSRLDAAKTEEERSRLQAEYDRRRSTLVGLPQAMNTALSVTRATGYGEGQRIYDYNSQAYLQNQLLSMSGEGQNQFMRRMQPFIEADQFVKTYEAKQAEYEQYKTADLSGEENAAALERQALLAQELALYKEKYELSKAITTQVAAEGNFVRNNLEAIKAQDRKPRVISRGTPAQFVAPDIFDVSDFSTQDLQAALQFARDKQSQLIGLNPGYRDVFAKDQFLMESAGQFVPVAGINQGFVQEYMSRTQAQRTPPEMVDLSDMSPEAIQKTIQKARALQESAIGLAPEMRDDIEKQRLMILGKNNDLLLELGLSQEFLRAALDDNTKSNELRGHYNLPASYRPPTIWDYYDSGGTSAGDMNFVPPGGSGVPLDLATKIASEMLKGGGSGDGPDLSSLGSLIEPGAAPMFFPNPGTGSIIEEMNDAFVENATFIVDKGPERPVEVQNNLNAVETAYEEYRRLMREGRPEEANKALNRARMLEFEFPSSTAGIPEIDTSSDTQNGFDAATKAAVEFANKSTTAVDVATAALTTVGQFIPGFNTAVTSPVKVLGDFQKQLISTIGALKVLDKSKVNLAVQITINGNQAVVEVVPEGSLGGTTGSSLRGGGGGRSRMQ